MAVHILVRERTHRSSGPATHGFVISNLLERAQPEFGSGLLEISIELVCRAPSRIGVPIERDEVVFGVPVAKLPVGKFISISKRYNITALSKRPGNEPIGLHEFNDESLRPEAERKAEFARKRADINALLHVFDEVSNALAVTPPRLKPSAFDWSAFVEWFLSLKGELPTTLEGVEAAIAAGSAAATARVNALDPWKRLEINWKAFHPDARKLLPDPFFWEVSDDFAPHGNDEGSDVLARMRRHPRKAVFTREAFVALAGHFDKAVEAEIADAEIATAYSTMDDSYLDFIVATAYGHIKLKGCCPAWLRDKALAVMRHEIKLLDALIARDTSGMAISASDAAMAPHRSPKREALKRLTTALERMPDGAPSR